MMIGAVSVVWQRLQLAADHFSLCLGSARGLAPHIFVRLRLKVLEVLKAVKEPYRQTARYLNGKTPSKCWRQVGGKLNRINTDWKMLKGRHGGGSGDGLPHVRVSFLKAVWAKHCSHRA